MQEAARQLGYYGYEAHLIDTPEQLLIDAASIPTGILVDCDAGLRAIAGAKAELTAGAQRAVVCISDRSDIGMRAWPRCAWAARPISRVRSIPPRCSTRWID
jgi:hypothetical protein